MFTAILVYQGLIEDVMAFDTVSSAANWLRELSAEYGSADCEGSGIWNHQFNEPVELEWTTFNQ